MKLHPFHPISVHAPLACVVFAPIADLVATLTGRPDFWIVGAWMTVGAVIFGLIAATFGALDFERGHAAAPKTVIWHAMLMVCAVGLSGLSAFGRFSDAFSALNPPPLWAIGASALALLLGGLGAAFGGELVYRHGVNVDRR